MPATSTPVAVLLEKVGLEYLPRYGARLAEAVRKWGAWVREQAIRELRSFYPLDPDGSEPLAYLWARTIRCEGPGCGAEVPLVGLLWLSRKEKQWVALRYRGVRELGGGGRVEFEIFSPRSEAEVQPPIVKRFAATCPVCGYTTPYARVREQIRAKRGGTREARLIAVITRRPEGSRGFRLATEADREAACRAAEELSRRQAQHTGPLPLVPDEPFPDWYSGVFNPGLWNLKTWGDIFSPRQALALSTFVRLVQEAHARVREEEGDAEFARAVATCLAVAVSDLAHNYASTTYYLPDFFIYSIFQGSGLPMKGDFVEQQPLNQSLRGLVFHIDRVAEFLEGEQALTAVGTVRQGSSTALPCPMALWSTWLPSRPTTMQSPTPLSPISAIYMAAADALRSTSHLFCERLTPKAEECIMDPGPPPPGEPEKTKEFFEQTMQRALAEARRVLRPDGVAVVLFAHKGTAAGRHC